MRLCLINRIGHAANSISRKTSTLSSKEEMINLICWALNLGLKLLRYSIKSVLEKIEIVAEKQKFFRPQQSL